MDALTWPDFDDVGYEFRREALLSFTEDFPVAALPLPSDQWTDPVVHWQKPAAAYGTARCTGWPARGRIPGRVTACRDAVTCEACKQSRAWALAVAS